MLIKDKLHLQGDDRLRHAPVAGAARQSRDRDLECCVNGLLNGLLWRREDIGERVAEVVHVVALPIAAVKAHLQRRQHVKLTVRMRIAPNSTYLLQMPTTGYDAQSICYIHVSKETAREVKRPKVDLAWQVEEWVGAQY